MRADKLSRLLLGFSLTLFFYGCAGAPPIIKGYQRGADSALSNADRALESNHPEEALHLVHIALKNHQLSGDLPDSVHDMNRIGYIETSLGDYAEANLWFQRAGLLSQVVGNQLLDAETTTLSSDNELFLKNPEQARERIEKGFKLIAPLPSSPSRDHIEAHLYNSYGILMLDEKKWNEALISFQKSLEINQRLKEPKKQAGNLANIGNVYLALNHPRMAEDAFSQALVLDKKTEYPNGIAFDSEGLALTEFHLNHWQKALQFIFASYQIRLQQKNLQQTKKDLNLFYSILAKHPLPMASSLLESWPAPAN
ncbi:MAG: tetratricopeptide repeat protein [Leptospirales bacterium]